jgi:hypothetical protein
VAGSQTFSGQQKGKSKHLFKKKISFVEPLIPNIVIKTAYFCFGQIWTGIKFRDEGYEGRIALVQRTS